MSQISDMMYFDTLWKTLTCTGQDSDQGIEALKDKQSLYGKMCLFENISVTHLGQKSLEYMSLMLGNQTLQRQYMLYIKSFIRYCTSLKYVLQLTPWVITAVVQ